LQGRHLANRQTHSFIASSARPASLPARGWNPEFTKRVYQEGQKDRAYQQARKEAEEQTNQTNKGTLRIQDELLYRKDMLWVPEELIREIMESEHDTKVAGHMGQDKTIELIRRNFWWPKMNERIIDFVQSGPECQRNKASRHRPYGLSSPLELPYVPWQSIAMDFITDLPLSNECDQLWVIIDRFTKMAHFVPLQGKTSADLAVIFAKEIWRLHGLPTDIVSD